MEKAEFRVGDVAARRCWRVGGLLKLGHQEGISRLGKSGHWCDAADALMRAMPVLVIDPVIEGGGAPMARPNGSSSRLCGAMPSSVQNSMNALERKAEPCP